MNGMSDNTGMFTFANIFRKRGVSAAPSKQQFHQEKGEVGRQQVDDHPADDMISLVFQCRQRMHR